MGLGRRRKSPRPHKVHTKAPRYHTKVYSRGSGTFPQGEGIHTAYNPYGYYQFTMFHPSHDKVGYGYDEIILIAKATRKDDDGLTFGQGLDRIHRDKPLLKWNPRKSPLDTAPPGEYLVAHDVNYDLGLNERTIKWIEANLKPIVYRPIKGLDRTGILIYGKNGSALIWGQRSWKTPSLIERERSLGVTYWD